MTQTSYPFDATDTTEAQFSQMFRRLQFTGTSGSPSTTDLKASVSSGMIVSVASGWAFVRGHFYKSDAAVSLTISAASSNPRKDLICLKLDPTANSVTLVVKTGTAGASPSDPTLTQTDEGTYEFPIARINVAANATSISAGNIDDLRQFYGLPFGKWTTTLRPSSPDLGLAGLNITTGLPEYWNGTAWTAFTPAITASMISSGEQANIVAGKIRAGGTSGGTAITVFVQSLTPTANATNDLWFW